MNGVYFYNTAVIVAFTVLAIIFKHWWIAMFALLFLFSHKERRRKDESEEDEP